MTVQTPNNTQEKYQFYSMERIAQNILDGYYKSRNHEVLRDPDKLHDVKIDGIDIEEKIRDQIRDDIAVEIIQDIVTGDAGWFTKTGCKYLHYIMCPNKDAAPEILYRINWINFKKWLVDKYLPEHKIGKYCYSSRGWGATVNILVPIKDIPPKIINRFEIEVDDEIPF